MFIYLSHFLNHQTPSYGNRNKFNIIKKSDISKGDIANDSFINTTVHMGTHIDMPYHFYENGQTIKDFEASFWMFTKILVLEVEPRNFIIKDEIIKKLEHIKKNDIELVLVKTNSTKFRNLEKYANENYGFDSSLAEVLINKFPKIRVFGFDTISVSSFTNRTEGRKAHKSFLNPKKPILLLEDMNLSKISENTIFKQIVISPILIENCDGLPCTVIGETNV